MKKCALVCVGVFRYMWVCIGPGPLNITFGSDMPITFFISEFTTYILLISIRGSNVLGISDPNVMFKGPGPGVHGYARVCTGVYGMNLQNTNWTQKS